MQQPNLQLGKSQLVDQPEREFGMLQHVIEAETVDGILGRVDVFVRILEVGLDHEGARIAGFGRRRMVRAGVAALGKDVGDVAVLVSMSASECIHSMTFEDWSEELDERKPESEI